MKKETSWDGIAKAALLLCFGPEILTTMQVGFPSDLALWEYVVFMPLVAMILGIPQIAMFAAIKVSGSDGLRKIALGMSVVTLTIYAYFVFTIDLTSNSTASISLFYIQSLLMVVSIFAVGFMAFLRAVTTRSSDDT